MPGQLVRMTNKKCNADPKSIAGRFSNICWIGSFMERTGVCPVAVQRGSLLLFSLPRLFPEPALGFIGVVGVQVLGHLTNESLGARRKFALGLLRGGRFLRRGLDRRFAVWRVHLLRWLVVLTGAAVQAVER